MHINVTIGLVGFLGTIAEIIRIMRLLASRSDAIGMDREARAGLAAASSTLLLCVRSFIAARRSGKV